MHMQSTPGEIYHYLNGREENALVRAPEGALHCLLRNLLRPRHITWAAKQTTAQKALTGAKRSRSRSRT